MLQGLDAIDVLPEELKSYVSYYDYIGVVDAFTWDDPDRAKVRSRLLRRVAAVARKNIEKRKGNRNDSYAELADALLRLGDREAADKAIAELNQAARDRCRDRLAWPARSRRRCRRRDRGSPRDQRRSPRVPSDRRSGDMDS